MIRTRAENRRLSYNHTERQTSEASETSDLCNGSGTHLECQVKRHHRLALVMLSLPLTLTLDARCGYTLKLYSLLTSSYMEVLSLCSFTLTEKDSDPDPDSDSKPSLVFPVLY